MKKVLAILFLPLMIISCGGNDEEGEDGVLEIKTSDIKGTLKANPDHTSALSNSTGNLVSQGKTLQFDGKGEISVYLINDDLTQVSEKAENSSFYSEFEFVDQGDNFIHYKIKKDGFGDKKGVEGYKFKVVMPYSDDTFVCLEGSGENKFEPISDKAVSKELLDMALTFEKK